MAPTRRILVIEDDHDVAHLVRVVLERGGDLEVLLRFDGSDLEQTIREHSPDVLVTDVELPDRYGLELAQIAKALDPDLPPQAWPYLEVRVLLDGPEPGLRGRIEAALAGKPVRLAKIEPTRKLVAVSEASDALSLEQLARLQPDDIFRRLWQQRFGDEAPPDQIDAFAELFHAVGDAK